MIEDIKKSHRSLREVLPTKDSARATVRRPRIDDIETQDLATKPPRRAHAHSKSTSSGKFFGFLLLTLLVAGVVVLSGYFVAPFFTKVTINIEPKEMVVSIDRSIKASRDNTTGDLAFTVLPSVEKIVSATVPATGSKQVEVKASGKIKISNNFSSAPQPLVAGTRFATTDGKIYRVDKEINVPGNGSLEVTVYADKPGNSYNIALTDFTLPGLTGSARFTKITAKSVTPMTGGFIGEAKTVSPAAEKTIIAELSAQLKKDLMAEIAKQLPEGFVAPESLVQLTYSVGQAANTSDPNNATFEGRGSATAILFNENDLNAVLAADNLSETERQQSVKITNLDLLSLSLVNTENTDLTKTQIITVKAKGEADFVWQIDVKKLAQDLAGHPKKDFAALFNSYNGAIASSSISFTPRWSGNFPSDPGRIKINLLTAKGGIKPLT